MIFQKKISNVINFSKSVNYFIDVREQSSGSIFFISFDHSYFEKRPVGFNPFSRLCPEQLFLRAAKTQIIGHKLKRDLKYVQVQ